MILYFEVHSFTNELFRGNPAGVCPLDEWLEDSMMQKIAAENNLSETAFFVPKEDHYELRWFTPKIEVGQGGEINVMLKPEKGYENTEVSFEGKTDDDTWLDKKGMKYGDGRRQVLICVKPNQALGEYTYNVIVDGVGHIDPRAIVIQR